jgi:multidrug efflux system membrane fusion protein
MRGPMTSESITLPDTSPRPRRRLWIPVLLLVAAALGFLWWRTRGDVPSSAPPAGRGAGENRPVSVVVTQAQHRDVPVYLEGLGTVTANKTVTVHPRVEGQLQTVAFKEGQAVKQGTLLAQIDARPFAIQLHTAQAALARDTAQLKGARINLERYQQVRAEKLIAQQQVDDQQTMVDQLSAQVHADEAQVENARLQLDYARITSPIDGVTGVRLIDPGNVVHVNDPTGIVIVAQLDPIAVLFTLPQDELPQVSAAMAQGPLSVVALSRDGQTELGKGQVELVDNQINATTSTIRLKALFPNPTRALWPNQFVKARLLLTVRKGATTVPAVAVQRGPKGPFVYAVSADQKAVMRPVEVADTEGELAIISKGIEPSDTIVIDGQSQLRPGSLVAVKGPDQGQRGGGKPGGGERRAGGGDRRAGGGGPRQAQTP